MGGYGVIVFLLRDRMVSYVVQDRNNFTDLRLVGCLVRGVQLGRQLLLLRLFLHDTPLVKVHQICVMTR